MKERIKNIAGSFFISVTLINLAILILGKILRPEQQFGYEVFAYPLIYGVIGIIPALFVRSDKELTVKQAIIKEIAQMMMTVVAIVVFIFVGQPLTRDILITASAVALSIVIIYCLVVLIGWLMDLRTARVMTEDLKRFQEESTERESA
jgi:protein-S-isoprenylcysteine O-methyltransferase Ste14